VKSLASEPYKYSKLFPRNSKNVYITAISKDFISQMANSKPPKYVLATSTEDRSRFFFIVEYKFPEKTKP